MKTNHLLTIILLAGTLSARAQFNSGSSGAYGPMNITTNTALDLPPDGIFHCTTITVASNVTLRFNRNTNNTPVYLLATGDVKVMGVIDVSGSGALLSPTNEPGRGGPGGFDGGWPGFGGNAPGDGYGPGGGKGGFTYVFPDSSCWGIERTAGYGAYAELATGHYHSTNRGNLYGSPLLVPLLGGSGGGGTIGTPGVGGGGGGGAILIAGNTKIEVSGTIRADGGRGHINGCADISFGGSDVNPGSGGAIRLVAPAVLRSGLLSAAGPIYAGGQVVASLGRVRIDSIDHRFINFSIWGAIAHGSYMVVFPNPVPRLDLINVAGAAIPQGSGPVTIQLPNGSDTNRTVTVQARDFNAVVPISVVLTPENGTRTVYTNVIDNASANPATVTLNVGLPVSTPVTVSAWTRVP